jgi:hypothetical protein
MDWGIFTDVAYTDIYTMMESKLLEHKLLAIFMELKDLATTPMSEEKCHRILIGRCFGIRSHIYVPCN